MHAGHSGHLQVAQWAMIAHLGASIMFGDTIIYDAQKQVTLTLKLKLLYILMLKKEGHPEFCIRFI